MKKAYLSLLISSFLFLFQGCQPIAEFSALNLEIVVDTGIEISLDNKTFLTTLSTQRINEYLEDHYQSFAFTRVTTENGTYFSSLELEESDLLNQGYIEFPIYFRSDLYQNILWNHIELSSMLKTFIVDIPFMSHSGSVSEGDSLIYNAANAYRISIEGILDEEVNHSTYEMPSLYNYNTVLGSGGDFTGEGEGYPGMYNYFYQKNQSLFPGSDDVKTIPTVTQVNHLLVSEMSLNEELQIFEGEVIIRIWIEGYDPDAYDFILNDQVSISLSFSGA